MPRRRPRATTRHAFSAVTALAILLEVAVFAVFVGRGITKPLAVLVGLLQRLAKGEEVEITGTERKDEIGATARAVNGIKECWPRRREHEAEEKAEQDRQAAAERDAALAKMADEFQAAVGGIVQAAVAGDFSQRVALEGKTGLVLNVGTLDQYSVRQCREGAGRSRPDAQRAGRRRSHPAHHRRISGRFRRS